MSAPNEPLNPITNGNEWFRVTLASIGDAVIATDTAGLVSFMNSRAEAMTEWPLAEAAGKPLDLIFHIINEFTRKPAVNPVGRVLREGNVVGLANHTLLISRNGIESPIADSAAPIRDANGKVIGVVLVFHDVTEQKQAEHALLESERRFRLLVESVRDYAIFMLDPLGNIASWNRGAERIKGYRPEEIIGSHFSRFYSGEDVQCGIPDQELKDAIRDGRVEAEGWRYRKDGSRFWANVTITAVRDESDRLIGFGKVTRDMTERRQTEQALRDLNESLEQKVRERTAELEQANRMKDEFLATVSHELRTPLTPMLGWIRILQNEQVDKAMAQRGIQVIEKNIHLQTRLIEDLLDVSRIISGKLKIDARPVGLAQVMEAAMDVVRSAAEVKSIKLEFKMHGSVPHVHGDSARLQQVFWNLLSNAVRHTPPHGVVEVELSKVGEMAEIRVSDSGEGIDAEYLPFVFDRFSQADSSTKRRFGGLGIGLSIVKQIVELHGGNVKAQSAGKGKGAVFTVQIPLSTAVNIPMKHDYPFSGVIKSDRLKGIKILAVDDELDARDLLTVILGRFGAEVLAVDSAKAAIEALRHFTPHVLITDIGMPDEDGYDLLRKFRALEAKNGKTTPAMALTAFARDEDRLRALSEGFQFHMPKPVEPETLVEAVAQLAKV